jgi:hypothetical protein
MPSKSKGPMPLPLPLPPDFAVELRESWPNCPPGELNDLRQVLPDWMLTAEYLVGMTADQRRGVFRVLERTAEYHEKLRCAAKSRNAKGPKNESGRENGGGGPVLNAIEKLETALARSDYRRIDSA